MTAAGVGIGAAVASELAAGGYKLALMSRSEAVEQLARARRHCAARLDRKGRRSRAPRDRLSRALWPDRCGRQSHRPSAQGRAARDPRPRLARRARHAGPERDLDLPPGDPVMLAQGGGAIVNVSTFATTGAGCRRSGSARCRRWPGRSLFCCPRAPASSPARTSGSTAASPGTSSSGAALRVAPCRHFAYSLTRHETGGREPAHRFPPNHREVRTCEALQDWPRLL